MDINRFFTLGPATPFQANEVFTNREAAIRTFVQRASEHTALSCPVDLLMDFQRPARNVLSFIGQGGLGKTTLLHRAADLAASGEAPELPERTATAVINFADPATHSFEAVLLRVRAALGSLGRSWAAFDLALALYWERKHPGESLVTFLRRTPGIIGAAAPRIADQVSGAVDQLVGGFGVVGLGYQLLTAAGTATARNARLRRLKNELPAFEALVNERDPDRMIGYLPVLLAYDLEQQRSRTPLLALCLLDTFEHVQALPAQKQGLEDLVSRLVYLMPNVLFLLASRRPLRWHDPVYATTLTYGGIHRWPGLGGTPTAQDQLRLDGFDDDAAERYLSQRLTIDNQPAIPLQLRRRIIAGSAGSPHYLELSAALYEQIASRGHSPDEELFGLPFPELVIRVMRDLDTQDRDLLRAAALLTSFDAAVLSAVLPAVRQRRIEEFLRHSFIVHDASVWPPYRIHENLRQAVSTCDDHTPDGWTTNERRRHALRAAHHLTTLALNPDSTEREFGRRAVAAFLLALQAATEHGVLPTQLGHLAYLLYEQGHWQVLTALPSLPETAAPELARLATTAELSARQDTDARERYARLKPFADTSADATYAHFTHVVLGNLAFYSGDLGAAQRYFTLAADEAPPLGTEALLGLAGLAHRTSRFSDHRRYTERLKATATHLSGLTDSLGHLELHNGRFPQAAALFEQTLQSARTSGAPLWIARGTRHLALANMWLDPAATAAVLPEARDLNTVLGDVIGMAQCDFADAFVHAHRGQWNDAERLLKTAIDAYTTAGVTFDLLPGQALQVLFSLARGHNEYADMLARRLLTSAREGHPVGPPAWCAITTLWTGHPDWYPFDSIDWIDPDTAADRWSAPLMALRAAAASGE